MNNDSDLTADQSSGTTSDAIQALLRFARALRYRKRYVITSLVVAMMLGTIYYFTAAKIYKGTASLLVTQTGNDVWSTRMSKEGGSDALMPTYEKLFSSDVVLDGAIRNLQQLSPEMRIDFASLPRDKWSDVLRDNLSAKSTRRTNMIELDYRSKSPEAAQATVDAIVKSYLDFMDKNHRDVSFQIATLLKDELADVESRLSGRQKELLEAQTNVRAYDLGESEKGMHPLVQRVIKLNDALVLTQEERLKIEALLTAVHAAVRNNGDLRQHLIAVEPIAGRELIMGMLGVSSQFNEGMHHIEQKLISDRASADLLSEHYGPRHPEVIRTQRAIHHAELHLANYQQEVAQRLTVIQRNELGPMLVSMLEQNLSTAKAHEAELFEEYTAAENEAVALNGNLTIVTMLDNEVNRLLRKHDALLNRIETLDMREDQADVRLAIVGEPEASQKPVSPRLALVGLLCLVSGFGVGAAIVYVLEMLDDRFRSPEELKDQLGVPVLAIVRKLPADDNADAASLTVKKTPEAVETEAFRTLRTTLAFSGERPTRVAISSAEPSDGKTTVLANLATTYAQAGKRTLLIDGDLRRPGLTRLFGLRGIDGLSEVLSSDESLIGDCKERIKSTEIDNLDVLPCGSRPSDPAELLSGPRMIELIDWASDVYDQVLIDCPPVLAASDAAVVGRLVDGTMLVVQPSKNHRRTVLRAADGLTSLKVNLLGVVANQVSEEDDGNYEGYGYGYGSGYGYGDDELSEEHRDDEAAEPVPLERAA